jgi:hypothetical protein
VLWKCRWFAVSLVVNCALTYLHGDDKSLYYWSNCPADGMRSAKIPDHYCGHFPIWCGEKTSKTSLSRKFVERENAMRIPPLTVGVRQSSHR